MTTSSIKVATAGISSGSGSPATAQVNTIRTQLAAYKAALSGRQVSSKSARVAMTALSKVMLTLINSPERDAWDTVLQFYRDNAKGVCRDTIGLTGVMTYITDAKARKKIIFLVGVFKNIVDEHTLKISEKEFMDSVPVTRLWLWYKREVGIA